MRKACLPTVLVMAVLIFAQSGRCDWADQGWKTIGIRGGISATQKHEYFHRYGLFALYGLPWSLRGESGWGVAMRANMSAGLLRGGNQGAFLGGLGPTVVLDNGTNRGFQFELDGSLDVVSRHVFASQDFNGNLLFEGAAGLTYRFGPGYGLGYQFQHISNGGIYGNGNPGVDLHTLSLSLNF